MKDQKILIVDDSEMNRALLMDILEEQYDIEEAANGADAIAALKSRAMEFSLILLDIVMPGMDGFEVLTRLREMDVLDNTAVIMISADDSNENIRRAYDLGAFDYICRPFDSAIVRHRVGNTMLLYAKQHQLEDIVVEQIYEREKNSRLMISILSHIVEFRNGESGWHVTNVGTITELLLHQLVRQTDRYALSSADIALISTASALHDIGKISIPDEVLNKPGRLTAEEFEMMKRHAPIGADMLRDLPMEEQESGLVRVAHDICRWHHERYDGRGYPDGLKGDEIPISAQVVAMADVYDALTSERCYKKAIPHDEAMRMIQQGQCGTFNPLLLECLAAVGDEIQSAMKARTSSTAESETISNVRQKLESQEWLSSKRNLAFVNSLEYERQRVKFLAEVSQDNLFSLNFETSILTMNPSAARRCGLEESISSPEKDAGVQALLGDGGYERMAQRIRGATPDEPYVRMDLNLHAPEGEAPCRCVVRVIWTNEDSEHPAGLVGAIFEKNPSVLEAKEAPRAIEPADGAPEGYYSVTSAEAAEIIGYLRGTFDDVRLVDASCERQGRLDGAGGFIPAEQSCFSMWNKAHRCENCVAAKVLASKGKASKLEFMDDEAFYVTASYLEVDGTPYALIMVSRMTDETLLEAQGKDALTRTIRSHNSQLYCDALTGVYNRRYYEEQLKGVARNQAIVIADVDDFKRINDRYGHQAGDAALKRVSEAIASCVRKTDDIIRYGGDEFIMVFNQIPIPPFKKKLEEIRAAVERAVVDEYPEIRLSVSIGGICGTGGTAELFQIADSVMYRAKQRKNTAMAYSLEEWNDEMDDKGVQES